MASPARRASARTGAIVLCGGRSHRMGEDKAVLPFGKSTLLERVLGQIAAALGDVPRVCVAAATQQLPKLPASVQVVRDPQPHQGPLAALATGLRTIAAEADVVFVTGCDAPLLEPATVQLLGERLSPEADAAVVVANEHRQPLLAAYRPGVLATADQLLNAGKGSLKALLDALTLCEVSEHDLRAADPDLRSLVNCNDHDAYQRALALAELAE